MTVLRCTRDLSIDKISENKEMEVKCANKLIVMSNIRDACPRTVNTRRTDCLWSGSDRSGRGGSVGSRGNKNAVEPVRVFLCWL